MADSRMVPFFPEPSMDDLKPYDLDGDEVDELMALGDRGNDDNQSLPDEEVYDAINDETFGGEILALSADDDLTNFATRTANLALFEDEPSSSMEPPDPSQIPIPHIRSDRSLQFSDEPWERKKDAVAGTGQTQPVSSSIWSSGSFNGIGSLSKLYMGHELKAQFEAKQHKQHNSSECRNEKQLSNEYTDQQPNFAIGPLPGLEFAKPLPNQPQCGLMNAADLERKFLEAAAAAKQSNLPPPLVPQGCSTMDSSELERKMIEEAQTAHLEQQRRQTMMAQIFMATMSANARSPSTFSQSPSPFPPAWQNLLQPAASMPAVSMPPQQQMPPPLPPPHSQFFQQWQHQIAQAFSAMASAGHGSPMPSGMLHPHCILPPPLSAGMQAPTPSQIRQHYQQQQPMCSSGPPFPGMGTGIVQQMPQLQSPIPIQSPNNYGLAVMPQLHMVPASLHPQVEKQRRQKVHSTLPSGKTISDYALDPYAGLMSTKEREWLIKIHLIRCLGTGDPMDDDFYYTVWKQKNVLTKAPDGYQKKEEPKYYSFETTFPSTGYIAPSFMGSLGKPVHSSSSQPRQIIEVISDNTEDESANNKNTAANRQKRLRAMLMKIENAALMLIDCRDIRRKLHFFEETRITEFIDKSEITDRMARFAENLAYVDATIFGPDHLPTVMLIQKGRTAVYDWLHFLQTDDQNRDKTLAYMRTLLGTMGKFGRKVPDESLKIFADAFCSLFEGISTQNELFTLLECVRPETSLIKDCKLVQLVLLSLLAALLQNYDPPISSKQLRSTSLGVLLFDLPGSALQIWLSEDDLLNAQQHILIQKWLIEELTKQEDGRTFSSESQQCCVADRICKEARSDSESEV